MEQPVQNTSLRVIPLVIAASIPGMVRAADATAPAVEVIGISPVRGLEIPRNDVPSPVQSIATDTLADQRMQTLPELLGNRLGGVTVNETTGNPHQTEVSYRGFTASPLLGTPQGLSVYQDGVRINEPFGETVNWDLIPRTALAAIDLIPGSNPLFGLNTLGGALSIATKSGLTHRGAGIEASAGSFGQRRVEAEVGRRFGDTGVYVAGSRSKEDGWRDFSPSLVDQAFAKLSGQQGRLEWDLAYTGADTDVTGNGLLPESMLSARRESVFTRPDRTRNRMDMLSLNGGYWLNDQERLSLIAYHRENKANTLNGDVNDAFEGDPALDGDAGANGGLGFNSDTAANNRTRSGLAGWGAALQWSRADDDNRVAFGATFDRSTTSFRQTAQAGVFDATRGVVPGGAEVVENRLAGATHGWSVFATDTYKPGRDLAVTTSLRYNDVRVTTRDELTPLPPNLDGDHRYRKFNPALGAAWTPVPALTVFANAAQGNRAPSPIELGCADPANPCSLPNAMQADPYLKQVVTRTVEAGVRGGAGATRWSATLFRAENHDDILFVGTSTSAGYFTNFGRTRREGLELGIGTVIGAVTLRADYAYVKATYRSAACLLAANNSTRGQSARCTAGGQDDEILVQPGNRMPGIPLHSLKLGAEWHAAPVLVLAADLVAYSSQYLRGNENNAHSAGTYSDSLGGGPRSFLGAGSAPGYAVLNLAARLKLDRRWTLSARLSNVFDKEYATAGALAENPFDGAGTFQTNSGSWTHESFYAPGAPRSIILGAAMALD
jgi:outer membrane receptor protein involved in Fe transport